MSITFGKVDLKGRDLEEDGGRCQGSVIPNADDSSLAIFVLDHHQRDEVDAVLCSNYPDWPGDVLPRGRGSASILHQVRFVAVASARSRDRSVLGCPIINSCLLDLVLFIEPSIVSESACHLCDEDEGLGTVARLCESAPVPRRDCLRRMRFVSSQWVPVGALPEDWEPRQTSARAAKSGPGTSM